MFVLEPAVPLTAKQRRVHLLLVNGTQVAAIPFVDNADSDASRKFGHRESSSSTSAGAFAFTGVVEGGTLQVTITPLRRANVKLVVQGQGAALRSG
jgi:hypothetical protein